MIVEMDLYPFSYLTLFNVVAHCLSEPPIFLLYCRFYIYPEEKDQKNGGRNLEEEIGMIGILLGLLMHGENLFDDGYIAEIESFSILGITSANTKR